MPQSRELSTAVTRGSSEELLLDAVRRPKSFGELYDRFEAELLRFFLHRTHRAELAADLTAETFAAALESARSFDPERGSARSWLFGIARHQLADAWRQGQVENRARLRLGMEPLILTDDTLERIDALEPDRGRDALTLLEELPQDQRVAVHGRVIEERAYPELAGTLAVSESVVRQRVSRGLRNLRQRLEQGR